MIVNILAATTPILLILLAGVGWLYRHEREKRDAIEQKLSQKKYEIYTDLIDVLIGMLHEQKNNTKINEKKIVKMLQKAQKQLLMYGSDEVLGSFIKLMTEAYNPKGGASKMIGLFSEFLISIRKDMGNPDTKINADDVLRMMITDYDEYLKGNILIDND